MNSRCDYSSFFNEFKIKFDLKFKLILFYNDYFFIAQYDKNLQDKFDDFKHDLLYALPLNPEGKPEVFLKNLHDELMKKENSLSEYKLHIREKRRTNSPPHILNIRKNIIYRYRIRNLKMQNKQLLILRNAISITEQAIESFNFKYTKEELPIQQNLDEKIKTKIKAKSEIVWNDDKVGLIQLIKSLIKVKAILIGPLRENEAVTIISKFLNISINKNNLSSFSRAIHSNNVDYQPEIFGKIIKGYQIIEHQKRERLENINK